MSKRKKKPPNDLKISKKVPESLSITDEYQYVREDLRRIGLIALVLIVILLGGAFIL